MNSADELARSYEWCYRVARASGSSFYRAFWLLERPERLAMFTLYAFARITDDLSDSASANAAGEAAPASGPKPRPAAGEPVDRRAVLLTAWRRQLAHRIAASAESADGELAECQLADYQLAEHELAQYELLWPGLKHTVRTYGVPVGLLEDLITGVAMDLHPVRLQNWSQVDRYCYHVASTVGLACTSIWRAADSLPLQQAIDCGLAFQLTNILRDLREDAARNRIYLPIEELQRYGCDVDSWLAQNPRGDWVGLVSSVVERTHALYDSGAGTVDHLSPRGGRMFALMWSSYRQLLEAVDRHKEQLWTHRRLRVSTTQRLRLLAETLLTAPTSKRLRRGK